jgi:hypothetical protein
MWWYSEASNWNAVCWARVIIAIFCALDDYDKRHFLSSIIIKHSQAYKAAFRVMDMLLRVQGITIMESPTLLCLERHCMKAVGAHTMPLNTLK